MSDLKLYLFGAPHFENNGRLIGLERRKALALLAYLAVTGKSHSRETLATLFWPEADPQRSRSDLRRDLSVLNKTLDNGWFNIDREMIGLKTNPRPWVDVLQFRQALATCQEHNHAPAAVCPACLPHLREAVSFYSQDFLAGFTLRDCPEFDEWQQFQTESLRRELAETLERLVRGQSAQDDFKAAIPYARRWLALDSLHEPAHRQLMELYARAGQRAAALHQYQACERVLQEELGVPPSVETTALAERIRLESEGQQGQLIKSYELKELIGAGGFGEVYRAYQPQVRREVAIKSILPQYANQSEFVRRFEAEAHVVAQLEHPHIVPLYDYWREPGGAYLVMRWLRGGSLEDALKNGPWSPEASAKLLDQIADALLLAHQRGIIHRDLKPANILLDENGNAYLTDFGIAKQVTVSASLTQAGVVMGSPAYIAPETVNDEPLTPQTDIYSLGVVLFEILTGQHPFPNTTPPKMIVKHLMEPLPSLQTFNSDLPPALNEVIQQATAKKPTDRYDDTRCLAQAFHQALTPEGVYVIGQPDDDTPLLVPNPYKGLYAFQEADAADFFGRDALIEQLLVRLMLNLPSKRQLPPLTQTSALHNFLAVVGPSGSGKSSVVKAGLIPNLRRDAIPGSKDWFIVEMNPGRHPFEELESALLRVAVNPLPTLLDQLQADERGLLKAVKRILPDEVGEGNRSELLLLIDQFEELFTLVTDETVRKQFLNSLQIAVTEPGSRLRVIITLRADFYDRPLLYSGFGDLLRQRMETILPMSTEELEQAIAGPAERVGAVLEPGLAAFIISDVQEQPGALPLMQYALTELFEHRQGRRLTIDAYQASGGVMGALARRADELFEELDSAGQDATRRLFLRLVTLGEGSGDGLVPSDTRRRVLRSELISLDGRQTVEDGRPNDGDWTMEMVIDTFGKHRLLTFDRDPATRSPTVEVAHEALIREWDRLRQWLDEDREFLLWQQRLRAAMHQWQANKQDEGALLRGAPLSEAENWFNQRRTDLSEVEGTFIQISLDLRERRAAEREQQRQRELEAAQKLAETEKQRAQEQAQSNKRLRWLAAGLVIFLLVATAAAIFAVQETRRAEQQARLTTARELAGAATNNLDIDPERSILLALQAADTTYAHDGTVTREAEEALHQAVQTSRTLWTFVGHDGPVAEVDLSPDGTRLATASFDGTAKVWDTTTGQEQLTLAGHDSIVFDVVFNPAGTQLATGSYDGTAKVWDAKTGQEMLTLSGHSGEINGVAFSPDGAHLATARLDGTANVWDAATGQELFTLIGHDDQVWDINFNPGGTLIATSSADGTARIWDAESGQELMTLVGHIGFVSRVVFSSDGRYVATGSQDRTAKVWDVNTGEELLTLAGHTAEVLYVRFSPDGNQIATTTDTGDIKLWRLEYNQGEVTGAQEWLTLTGHTSVVIGTDFSPDGTQLATGSFDGTARVWDVSPAGELLTLAGHTAEVFGLAFSPDGDRLASASFDGTAKVWDTRTGQVLLTLAGHSSKVNEVAFSPDGTHLATSSADLTAKIWDATTGQELLTLAGHTAVPNPRTYSGVTGVAFSPDGLRLATAGDDGTARVWDAVTGQELLTLVGIGEESDANVGLAFGGVTDVAFSPDGTYLATVAADGTARVWDAATGQELLTLIGDIGILSDVAFSPDGMYLVAASWQNGVAKVWDISTALETDATPAEALSVLTSDAGTILGVTYSPDGARLAIANSDGTAKIWDANTGQELLTLPDQSGGIFDVVFSPDGTRLATAGKDGNVRLYVLSIEELVNLAQSRLTRTWTTEECQQFLHLEECPEGL